MQSEDRGAMEAEGGIKKQRKEAKGARVRSHLVSDL